MRFMAAIHGADVKDEKKEAEEGVFKDPEYYKSLSEEERRVETERMKGRLNSLFKNTPLG